MTKTHTIFMVPSLRHGYALLMRREETSDTRPGKQPGILLRLKTRYYRWTESALAQERALKKARNAEMTDILYPSSMGEEEAMQQFKIRVRHEMRHHLIWLLIDFPLLIPAALAMVIPGPNIFFLFWAIRILGHYHAWDGGKRLLMQGKTTFRPSEVLDAWQRVLRDEPRERWDPELELLEDKIGLRKLRRILLWHEKRDTKG